MGQGKIYRISNIWVSWNTRKVSSDEAMLDIGKILSEYAINKVKKVNEDGCF